MCIKLANKTLNYDLRTQTDFKYVREVLVKFI